MKRLDSDVAVVLMSNLMAFPPPDEKEFRSWALSHQTLRELWDNCDRADWLKWVADVAASRGVIDPVQVQDNVSALEVRSRLGNPFDRLNQTAIDKRREQVSFWEDDSASMLDDIYAKLRIDEGWSVREKRRFTWWGHRLAQRVSVEKPRLFANQLITKLNIETDLWRDVPRTEKTAALVRMLNYNATLSAFVWDEQRGTIRLHASLYLDAENVETVTYLAINVTAMQAADAYIKIDGPASLLKATPDESLHPTSGRRREPDDMLNVIEQLYAPRGEEPSRFSEIDFESLAKTEPAPWVLATAGPDGLTAEFPFFGSEPVFLTLEGQVRTALFQVNTDASHPQLGNGVLLRLTLPVDADPVTLNLAESQEWTGFNQLGAWFHSDRGVSFVTFIPNEMFREGLLENLVWHTAARVKWTKETLFPSVPGFFSTNAATGVDCTQLTICGSCYHIRGQWSDSSSPERVMYQRCSCQPTEPEGYAPWPTGFDFHQVVELCNCCGIEVLRSGSRWSVWFCDSCQERVQEVHSRYRAYLLPIGRDSLYSGFDVTAEEASEPRKVSAFLGKTRVMGEAIGHLSEWAKQVVRQNLEVLGLAERDDTPLLSYCKAAAEAGLDKMTAFDGLCRHFELDPEGNAKVVRMARRREDNR